MAKLIGELHHWWPRTVSKFWEGTDGCAHRLSSKGGQPVKAPPKNFGAVRNDNHIKLGMKPTAWDQSFEQAFHDADSSFAGLIEWLLAFQPTVPVGAPMMMRLEPFRLSDDRHAMLAECLASLIIRSPNFRNRVRSTVDYFRERMGIGTPADSNLVGMNVRDGQRMLSKSFARRGKFVIMRATEREFIFGDGFFHTVSSAVDEPPAPKCVIPLTPELAVFYTAPMQYSAYPKLFAMNLSAEDVDAVNRSVQIYSRDEIFYRSVAPVISEEFACGQFRQFSYHQWPGLADFEDLVANGNWGPHRNYMADQDG